MTDQRNAVTLDLRAPEEFISVTGEAPAVTSSKFTEPLRDIPHTITVVPAAVIQAQGATTLRDVLRNVTGISIQAGEGGVPAGDNLSIHGFSARTDFFIDAVRDVGGYTRDPFNVEQVEVVKGPSSSIAGRGSTGGVINLATKTPHLGTTRSLSVGLGSSEYKRGTVDLNQPVGEKEFGNTPNHSLSLWSSYPPPRGVELGGGAQCLGDRFNSNTGTRTAPAYWVIGALAAYRVSEHLTVRANGLNVANERYIDRVGGGHFIPGPGRSVMLTADVGF